MRELPEGPVIELSPREKRILDLIAEGRGDLEIGNRLFIARSTVKTWKASLYKKLRAHNGAQAVHHAYQAGLLVAFGDGHDTIADQLAIVLQAEEMGYRLALVRDGGTS